MPDNIDAEFLFPTPSSPPSTLSPHHWPGVSPGSTQTLKEVLEDNHKRWHIFFNDRGFHNHSAHRAIAIWSLGADPAVITAAYKQDCEEQRPAFRSPEPITDANFEEHLGDRKFYDAYLNFFTAYVRENGIDKTLETFIFSEKYNTGNMEMLSRFMAGLLHPLIHTGHGAEFGLPGILIEGVAQACVHPPDVSKLLPKSFFDAVYGSVSVTSTTSASAPSGLLVSAAQEVGQVAAYLGNGTINPKGENIHALTILARVQADPRLTLPKDLDELMILHNTIAEHGDVIRDYAMQWSIDLKRPGEINRKVEEISWMNTVIYGVSGWTWAQQTKQGKEGNFNADFFFMHLVTSAAFIPSLLARISDSPHSQILLLRSYLAVTLSWYVARARPKLDLRGFFLSSTSTAYPLPINSLPTPNKRALPGQDRVQTQIPDPWLPIVQTTTVHPDQHLPKAIRALASWASKFGTISSGSFVGPQESIVCRADAVQGNHDRSPVTVRRYANKVELPGAEYLDGTLFIRTAGLTIARMGRVGQGEAAADFWDLTGFFEDSKLAEDAKRRIKERVMSEF